MNRCKVLLSRGPKIQVTVGSWLCVLATAMTFVCLKSSGAWQTDSLLPPLGSASCMNQHFAKFENVINIPVVPTSHSKMAEIQNTL